MDGDQRLISIIVPVYNVEQYIDRCIKSVLNQTYRNIEVILVDDGSPDRCGDICDDYKNTDSRVRVLHKENGGLSSARNTGMAAAKGKFFCFVDSDDWLDPNYVQVLYDLITLNDADMAACCFCKAIEGRESPMSSKSDDTKIFTENLMFHAITDRDYSGFVCNKLFRACYIRDNGIRFDERIFNGEDLPFTIEYLKYCNKIAFTPSELYFYTIRPRSITTDRRFSERAFTILYAREKVLAELEKSAPECVDIELAAYISHLIKMKYVLEPKKNDYPLQYHEVKDKLGRYAGKITSLNDVAIKTKMKLYLMVHFEKIIGMVYRKNYENSSYYLSWCA